MNLTEKFLDFALLGAEWVLWLLVLLSVFSVYVMIERWAFFRMAARADSKIGSRLHETLADHDWATARSLVKDVDGAGARIVADMLANADRGQTAVQSAMSAGRPREKVRLEHNLSYLGTLGANAPFIGLFGTVLGIIRAFKDLADTGLQATGESSVAVMAGISEALVATAVGLLVAIPAVVAYNYFQRRVKRLLSQADALANTAFAFIVGGPHGDEQPGESGE